MNAQQLVELKKKLVKARKYPWEYVSVAELAFLSGITDYAKIMETTALFYGSNVSFLSEFLKILDKSSQFISGAPMLQEALKIHNHFSGDSLIQYSPEYEKKEREIVSKDELRGKNLLEILSRYPKTVAWQFDYSVVTVDRFVVDVLAVIGKSSADDLESTMIGYRQIDPYILASLASHFVQINAIPKVKDVSNMGGVYSQIAKNLQHLPLQYAWHVTKTSVPAEDFSAIDRNSSGCFLDRVMKNAIIAREYEHQIEVEDDWRRLEHLYRKLYGIYLPKKKVLLRMIELCQQT